MAAPSRGLAKFEYLAPLGPRARELYSERLACKNYADAIIGELLVARARPRDFRFALAGVSLRARLDQRASERASWPKRAGERESAQLEQYNDKRMGWRGPS